MINTTHKEWCIETARETQKKVLRKVEDILKEDELYSQDLDNLKDCWKILWYIDEIMYETPSREMRSVVHEHEHTHVTQ